MLRWFRWTFRLRTGWYPSPGTRTWCWQSSCGSQSCGHWEDWPVTRSSLEILNPSLDTWKRKISRISKLKKKSRSWFYPHYSVSYIKTNEARWLLSSCFWPLLKASIIFRGNWGVVKIVTNLKPHHNMQI